MFSQTLSQMERKGVPSVSQSSTPAASRTAIPPITIAPHARGERLQAKIAATNNAGPSCMRSTKARPKSVPATASRRRLGWVLKGKAA